MADRLHPLDFAELAFLWWRAQRVGYASAYKHYPPEFADPTLGSNSDQVQALLHVHQADIQAWCQEHAAQLVDLFNAHLAGKKERLAARALWGVRYYRHPTRAGNGTTAGSIDIAYFDDGEKAAEAFQQAHAKDGAVNERVELVERATVDAKWTVGKHKGKAATP